MIFLLSTLNTRELLMSMMHVAPKTITACSAATAAMETAGNREPRATLAFGGHLPPPEPYTSSVSSFGTRKIIARLVVTVAGC